MFGSVLEAIKGEKKMSLNHWRYRVLHWAFAIQVTDWTRSKLPSFLYTHYCPLFHLTNLIVLMSPIILLAKVITATACFIFCIIRAIVEGIGNLSERIEQWKAKRRAAKAEQVEPESAEERHARRVAEEKRKIPKLIIQYGKQRIIALKDFHTFRCLTSHHWNYLTNDEVQEIWATYAPKVLLALEIKQARKEKMRERIIFWVNFSRIFIKGILNIFYFATFVGLIYLAAIYGGPVAMAIFGGIMWIIKALITFDWLGFVFLIGTWALRISIGIGTVVGLIWFVTRYVPIRKIFAKTLPPLQATFDAASAISRAFGNFISGVTDFVSVFYEENCPPITIVDDEEAKVAAVAEEN